MTARTTPSMLQLLAVGACLAGGAGAANAGVYTGTWDPAFTTTVTGDFAGLGWKVSAKVVIPDACGTTGVVLNGTVGACGAASPMTLEQVNLYFYSLASPATILGTINFGSFGVVDPASPGPASGETQELRTASFDVDGKPTLGTSFAARMASNYAPLSAYKFSFSLTNQITGAADPHLVYTTSDAMSLYAAEVHYNQRSAQGLAFGGSAGTGVPLVFTATPLGPNTPYADPFAPVPEPGTWAMLAAGLAAIGCVARRRRA